MSRIEPFIPAAVISAAAFFCVFGTAFAAETNWEAPL
jgi:hypothetical protein